MYAVSYARERVQGRHLLKALEDNAPSVPIIEHPDIRRMLLTMKVYVEGMRSLLYYIGNCEDKFQISANEEDKARYQGLMDVLIPMAKGYVTDKAFEVCSLGVQVYGGYGYIKEYPMEQLLRDCRITQIYEGTKGISLFLVPKIWVNDDGSLGEPNDVVCTGIEEKMGIHGQVCKTFPLKWKQRSTSWGKWPFISVKPP
jgi:alkylation response protein AidB-like acyl-CoA dehydrogenase